MIRFPNIHRMTPIHMTRDNRIHALSAFVVTLFFCLGPSLVLGVEHPGSFDNDAQCSTCHAKKISGKSVHSAMGSPCTVCHLTVTQGDMTTVSLSMPKGRICFACHEESAALRQHVPKVKGQCLECHDAHSSEQRMLLRVLQPLLRP